MKSLLAYLFVSLFLGAVMLNADPTGDTEVVIPTEISQPPYEVGNLISEQGYYIDLAEGAKMNFRIVENKIRIYWLDTNSLIMEPPVKAVTVRFTGSVRGKSYHRAVPAPGDVGLAAPAVVPPPHIYNVILAFESGETYAFRYTADMDSPKAE
jgi:hypothetical protein